MVFKYWMRDGKATVIKDVDRLVFNTLNELMVRSCTSGQQKRKHLVFEKDYIQFTMAAE